MATQPEALRLADAMEREVSFNPKFFTADPRIDAAAELRRLHGLNAELLAALDDAAAALSDAGKREAAKAARAAIALATPAPSTQEGR